MRCTKILQVGLLRPSSILLLRLWLCQNLRLYLYLRLLRVKLCLQHRRARPEIKRGCCECSRFHFLVPGTETGGHVAACESG